MISIPVPVFDPCIKNFYIFLPRTIEHKRIASVTKCWRVGTVIYRRIIVHDGDVGNSRLIPVSRRIHARYIVMEGCIGVCRKSYVPGKIGGVLDIGQGDIGAVLRGIIPIPVKDPGHEVSRRIQIILGGYVKNKTIIRGSAWV